MTNEPKKIEISFSVKKIKELGFGMNYNIEKDQISGKKIGFETVYNFEPNLSNEELILTIEVGFKTKEMTEIAADESMLLKIKIATIYHITNLQQFKSNVSQNFDFPIDFAASMLGIAFSHVRAILAIRTARTAFEDYMLPIINPKQLLEPKPSLFPE